MNDWKERKKEDCRTLTQPVSLELISFWTLTGVTSWVVNTLILTHVAGEAAFVNIWTENMHIHKHRKLVWDSVFICFCISVFEYSACLSGVHVRVCVCASVSTLTGDRILCQLVPVVTLAEEGADQVVAVVLTWTLHITFIHIWR